MIYIIGNSHTNAIRAGLQEINPTDLEIKCFPLGTSSIERKPIARRNGQRLAFFQKPVRSRFAAHAGLPYITGKMTIGLCMGTHTTRIFEKPFWSQAEPSEIATEGKQPISKAVVETLFIQDQSHVRGFLLSLKAMGCNVFAVACPPIRGDHACLETIRPEVCEYMDSLGRKRFTDWLAESRIPFIEPPQEAYQGDSAFLKDELGQKVHVKGIRDNYHANGIYGKMMAMKILEKLRSGDI